MAILIKDLIPTVLDKKILNAQSAWRIQLLEHWDTIVGELQTRVRLEKIFDDTLVIGVYESHWMQELFILSSVMVDSINTFLGGSYVKHLRFKLVEEKEKKAPKKNAKEKLPFDRTAPISLNVTQQNALNAIADEEFKQALIQFWARCEFQQKLLKRALKKSKKLPLD